VKNRLYVFSRLDGGEVLQCLDATSGNVIWKSEKFDVLPAEGPSDEFTGPRASPAVSERKVVTLGLRGTVSCYDAEKGTLSWRKEDFKGHLPWFYAASSPVVTEGVCIVQLGARSNGGVIAYDIESGVEKWRWTGEGASYASPQLMTIAGDKLVIAETDRKIIGLRVEDGKQVWEIPFAGQGSSYNSSTPVVDGNRLIIGGSGRGIRALKIVKEGDRFETRELWNNKDRSVIFNTPVLKGGNLFGVSTKNILFCIDKTGKSTWNAPLTSPTFQTTKASFSDTNVLQNISTQEAATARSNNNGRVGGRDGYAQIVDAGSVMLALTPAMELIAFAPDEKAYTELARIRVATSPTYAFPVISGKRIFVRDQHTVALFCLE